MTRPSSGDPPDTDVVVRARSRAALGLAGTVGLLGLVCALAVTGHRDDPDVDVVFILVSLWLGISLTAVGSLLLALRPRNLLGPVLAVGGAALTLEYGLREYAHLGLQVREDGLPGAAAAGWAGLALDPLFFPATLVLVLLLFPDGVLPRSRVWRLLCVAVVAVTAIRVGLAALRPGPLEDLSYGTTVPWGGVLPASSAAAIDASQELLNTALVLLLPACVVALVLRFRAARGVARQQFKPLVVVGALLLLGLVLQFADATRELGVLVLVASVAVGLPAALAVASLRYRLWDLDRVLVATLVVGGLAVLVTGLYVAVVVGTARVAGSPTTTGSTTASVLAAAVVALVFAPARDWLTRRARRLVLGVRATPYEALTALPNRLAEAPVLDDVLVGTAETIARGLGVPAAGVQVVLADGTRRTSWWPPGATSDERELLTVPVRHLGLEVGALSVRPSPDRPLGAADERLLADLAAQAGPTVHNVTLAEQLRVQLAQITTQAEQLRASRERIAAVAVDERRRLERDLHDGAQQRLTTLAVRLHEAEDLAAAGDPATAVALRHCRTELTQCTEDLRQLARGVYPPVLAARGLVAALRARLRTLPAEVQLVAGAELVDVRLGSGVELAAYFCCLEAVQNATRHATGAPVRVEVDLVDGALVLVVADDGPGFDRAEVDGTGSGLLGMEDRLAAVGGTLVVESTPGIGTTVRGRVPVRDPGPAAPSGLAVPADQPPLLR